MIALALALSSCRQASSVPQIVIDLGGASDELIIKDWQISGPFPVGAAGSKSSEQGAQDAGIDHDFLNAFGESETAMNASAFTEISRGLLNTNKLPSDFKNIRVHSENGVVRLDKLFLTKNDAAAYAACEIESAREEEVVLVSGADDALKVWLNGTLLLRMPASAGSPGTPAYGNLGKAADFRTAHLKRGKNFLLIKVGQLQRMWGFNCSMLTLEAARRKAQGRELYINDVLGQSLLAKANTLSLHSGLSSLLDALKLPVKIEILDSDKNLVYARQLNEREAWSEPVSSFREGLYHFRLTSALYRLEESFYYGDVEQSFASLLSRYRALPALNEKTKVNFEALLIRQGHLFETPNKQPQNKVWQRKIVYLINELENLLTHLENKREAFRNSPGTHLRGFRSRIDSQVQHYMVHLPASYEEGNSPAPLIVIVPYPVPKLQPFLKSVHVSNVDLISSYVKLADQYGYALLWPFARGNAEGSPVAVTDIFEALKDARADYNFDDERIYLLGWSLGGTYSLLLGARFPGLFAAIGAVMPPSDLIAMNRSKDKTENPYPESWLALNNPIELAESLSNTPVYIVHGDEDRTVPAQQSLNFVDKCKQLGFEPRLDIIQGMDHVYSPIDPNPLLFEFFRDKTLKKRPQKVLFATGQLKYDSAYWIKVDQLTAPMSIGRIQAMLNSETTIEVETRNIKQYDIRLDRLGYRRSQPLSIKTNGHLSYQGIPSGDRIQINLDPATQSSPLRLVKHHETEGPLSHAFGDSFLLVEGSAGSKADTDQIEALGREIREAWMKDYFVDCPHKQDWEVNQEDVRQKHLILLGNAETNSLIKKVLPNIPLKIEAEGLRLGDKLYSGSSLGLQLIYPNPLNNKKYIAIIGGNNLQGLRLIEPHLSRKGWYDFMIWDSQDGKVLDSGHWDAAWQVVQPISDL